MIIDLERFITAERPYWDEFERMLDGLDGSPDRRMGFEELQRFHLLYERTSAALAKMVTFSSEPQTRAYLEHLVARGYSELHETRQRDRKFQPAVWLFQTLPQTFRRHIRAF